MTVVVRPAATADAQAIADIYWEGIEDRMATFRTTRPSAEEMAAVLSDERTRTAWVAERAGRVVGVVLVIPYADVPAYSGVGEYMIYIAREARGSGVGRRLLEQACTAARAAGHWKLVGKLFNDNRASIALARACGFRDVGVHRRHGRLDGAWRDVLVVERFLGEP